MSSQTGVEKMNVNMFLDRVYEEHGELTPEFIIKLARAVDLDAYRTINMLCNYEELKNKCEQYADEYKTMAHQREQLYSQLSEARIAGEELNSKYETLKRKLEHSRDLEYLDRIFHGTGA